MSALIAVTSNSESAALIALSSDLNEYLRLGGPTATPPVETPALAAAFAQDFVKGNVTAIRKALDPDQRGKLPAGGLEALMLALAADDDLGTPFLRSLAASDDTILNPLARDVLALKDHPSASH